MRIPNMAVLIAVCTALACGGGEKKPSAGATTSAAPPPATGETTTATTGAPQAITGKTWDVKMIGDATGSRFDPPTLTIKRGDGVRWTVVSGVPHNVAFWPDSIPGGAASVLQGNMTQTMAPLTGPMLTTLNQTYTMSFAGAPTGTYHYYCVPHLSLGMKGTITVQ